MDTIKTFMKNAGKDTSDERESYTSSSTTDDSKQATSDTATESSTARTSKSTTGSKVKATANASEDYDSDITVLPPKTHEHHHKKIIDENETIVDRDHHVDHYKEKIQPIAVAESNDQVDSAGKVTAEERKIDHSNPEKLKKNLAAQDKAQDTFDEAVTHESVQKEDKVHDKVHHHMHETVQPVIEKDVYDTELRHNKKLVHEEVQDEAVVEPTEVLPTQREKPGV